jgi:hypothetical protein
MRVFGEPLDPDNNLGPCGAGSGAIGGNVRVNNNSGRVTIIVNTIAGNVQVNNNSGGGSE